MDSRIKDLGFFEKIKIVRDLIESTLSDFNGDEIMTSLCHLAHWHYSKKGNLTEKEMQLYDLLLRRGFNPSTVYKWFLLTKIPEDLKGRIKKSEITQKQALRMAVNRRRVKEVNIGLHLLQEAREVIRGL